jgi:hypothetical protein
MFKMAAETVSIFALTFNTQSIRLCESLDEQVVSKHRNATFTTWHYNCYVPKFWQDVANKIIQEKPTLVTISFQEDIKPGSYFHSHFLPEQMTQLGYKLFDRDILMGVGKTTFNGIKTGDPFVRGLRSSVYIRNDAFDHFDKPSEPQHYVNSVFKNKGAIGIYVKLPNGQILAIINAHLPFNSKSLLETVENKDYIMRQNAIVEQNLFFNQVIRKLVLDYKMPVHHVLFMGDLNYRISPVVNWSAKQTGEHLLDLRSNNPLQFFDFVNAHDEYRRQSNANVLYYLKEGVNDMGPLFEPTCKMKKTRDPKNLSINSYAMGKADQRVPSYCDRILYTSMRQDGPQLICVYYDRLDDEIIARSDHAAVIGKYTFAV